MADLRLGRFDMPHVIALRDQFAIAVKDEPNAHSQFTIRHCPTGLDAQWWKEILPNMAHVFLASRALHRSRDTGIGPNYSDGQ